ncbi:MAG: hypothetical protein ACRDCF_01175 [Mycoplasmoidaceae bacterium]
MKPLKIVSLILMLLPLVSLLGFLLYFLSEKPSGKELIICILTIPFGFFAGIFLWLNAFGVIKL